MSVFLDDTGKTSNQKDEIGFDQAKLQKTMTRNTCLATLLIEPETSSAIEFAKETYLIVSVPERTR